MELFRIFGSIFIQNEQADQQLQNTNNQAENTSSKLKSMIGTAAKVGAGIATGVAAGATALFGLATKAADTASNIKDMADRTGSTAEDFQKLSYAAEMSGMSVEGLEKAMIKQQTAFAKAKDGNKGLSEAYKKLGVDVNSIGNSSDAFNAVIAKLADMKDETQRNALANQIFGKSYADLTPLLNEGSTGIDALKQKAVDLGLVMSNDAVAAGEGFGDTLETLKNSFGMMATKIGAEALPIIQSFCDWVLANMPTIQSVAGTVFDAIGVVVKTTGDIFSNYLLPAFKSIWDWVQPYLPQIQAFFQSVFAAVGLVLQSFIAVIGQVINNVKQWLTDNQSTVNSIKQLFFTAFEYIKTTITTAINILTTIWNKYGQDIQNVIKTAWNVIVSVIKTAIDLVSGIFKVFTSLLQGDWSGAWEAIKTTVSTVWDGIKSIISNYIDYMTSTISLGLNLIKDAFSKVFEAIGNIVSGIVNGIKDSIKNAINSVISGINFFIRKINSIKINIPSVDIPLVGVVGGGSIGFPSVPEIPMLAEGGTIKQSGRVIVGEEAPEILDLPKGARVTPLDKAGAGEIVIQINNPTIMTDRDIDIFGNRLVQRLKALGVGV
jgi:hypothetical protein